ncbi:MAG: YceI family protein [Algoriphagus sp.]|nr:YceI family protein [Algoriphagus sp.]
MKRSILSRTLCLLSFTVLIGLGAQAQQTYAVSGAQELKVSGTSTIHDWDMVATDGITGTANMLLENGKLTKITTLTLSFPVKSLKSGKSSMDDNAYKALLEPKNPNIKFEMTELTGITGNTIKAKGKLTIAGDTQIVPMTVTYTVSGSTVCFTGTHPIKFTQFKVSPPSAVFNTIKTGDDLKLSFKTNFTKKN